MAIHIKLTGSIDKSYSLNRFEPCNVTHSYCLVFTFWITWNVIFFTKLRRLYEYMKFVHEVLLHCMISPTLWTGNRRSVTKPLHFCILCYISKPSTPLFFQDRPMWKCSFFTLISAKPFISLFLLKNSKEYFFSYNRDWKNLILDPKS